MDIQEKHKPFLRQLGLGEKDFERFDGKFVSYEYDEEKGVRIYDPDYRTSYNEYIGIDGWSAWSSENDTFMSDMLKKVPRGEIAVSGPEQEEITIALKKKFGKGEETRGEG
jgi:hypothetical protein